MSDIEEIVQTLKRDNNDLIQQIRADKIFDQNHNLKAGYVSEFYK